MVKLKAFTILEVVTAMLIIVFTLGIAMSVYLNLIETENVDQKIQAHLMAKEYLIQTKKEKSFVDDQTEKNNFLIEKSFKSFLKNENLLLVEIIVTDLSTERKLTELVSIIEN